MKKISLVLCIGMIAFSASSQSPNNDKKSVIITPPRPMAAGESTTNFIPETVGPVCATRLVKGDKDFDSNFPEIWSTAKLSFTRNNVVASITLRARETKSDLSEAKGTIIKVLYTAPDGYDITGIVSGKSAEILYTTKSATESFRAGALATTIKAGKGETVIDKNDGLVAEWIVTGNTDGDDIGVLGKCDENTKVSVRMNAITVKLKKRADLKPASSVDLGTTINLEDITEGLCPNRLTRGDREFDGHGPKVKSEVKLRIGPGGTSLIADITISAIETVHDWSTTEGRWSKTVYEAPYGKKITAIVSDKASRTQFISPPGGFQFIAPGADVAQALYTFLDYTDIKSAVLKAFGYGPEEKSALSALVKGSIDKGNTVVQVPPVDGTLVKFFHIVGDTGGPDISDDDNCNDDTRIVKIEFFPAKVKFVDVR